MTFPKFASLILFSILAATTIGSAKIGPNVPNVPFAPQRLRVRVDNQRLRSGAPARVIVEFLDRDYKPVANDATRVIQLGQGPGSSASANFANSQIRVGPGAPSGETSFTPSGAGRLVITANSAGLEQGQALVVVGAQSASLLTRFVSLFETEVHAQDEPQAAAGFDIYPRETKATANGKHRATFQVSFLESSRQNTIVRIITNLTNGAILYNGRPVGRVIANIALPEGENISGEIGVVSEENGEFDVTASVLPNGPTAQARVKFTRPRATQIVFDTDPLTISSGMSDIPLTVRLADEGGFLIDPESPQTIRFSGASESDRVSFVPESVVVGPGQPAQNVMCRLKELPFGNELKLLATNDQGMRPAQKSVQIKSAIEKILISGPVQVHCNSKDDEYTVFLTDKDGKHYAADWDRHVDLNISGGGVLSAAQLVIPKGARKAVVKFLSGSDAGKFVLTASSAGLADGTYSIGVTHRGYWLALFALLGGLAGGIARQLHKDRYFGRILPRWTGRHWDLGLVGRIAGSLAGALFFYWTFKLGLSQALGSPAMPVALDPGTRTVALFLGGIGGFAGTIVLDRLTKWFMPGGTASKAEAAPARP
jgi:hypothetical protein